MLAGSSVLHVAVTSIGDGATLPTGGQAHEYVEPTRALLPERLWYGWAIVSGVGLIRSAMGKASCNPKANTA